MCMHSLLVLLKYCLQESNEAAWSCQKAFPIFFFSFDNESCIANGHSSSCAGSERQLNGIHSSSAFDRCCRVNMDMLS